MDLSEKRLSSQRGMLMDKKIHLMVVGAHCGDAEIGAGAVVHKYAKAGHRCTFLHMTAGEKGAPAHISIEDYRNQKIKEADQAARILGAQSIVLDYKDAELTDNKETINHVSTLFRKLKPDIIITHWQESMHPDHALCPKIVNAAWLMAGLTGFDLEGLAPHSLRRVLYSENWEDPYGYEPDIYVDVTEEFETYLNALSCYWFILNSSSFRYLDYYRALGTMRGCLNRTEYAQAFMYPRGANVRRGSSLPGFELT
jgi:LmbE family N-acetylglucosaminyl deacetylase